MDNKRENKDFRRNNVFQHLASEKRVKISGERESIFQG